MGEKSKLLTGRQKAAVLALFLGPEFSGKLLQGLPEDQIDSITLEISRLQNVDKDVVDDIVSEFFEMIRANQFVATGGIRAAEEILNAALGDARAKEALSRLTSSQYVRPFSTARTADPVQLFNLIQNEHPQTIAMIMGYLQADKASAILKLLSPEIQPEVIKRIAQMERTSPETVREVESILEKKLSLVIDEGSATVGGIDTAVAILNLVDRSTEKQIVETLETMATELAEEIKKKMFLFEDVILIDDRGIQRIIREIEIKDLALALKGSTDEVKEKFMKNMSKRAGQMLAEDIDLLGPVRLRDVEDAQQKVVNAIRRLEDSGEIVITRGGAEETIV
ncbi:MAG: flagellar motor switch protein FliG [Candidatus Wallbacteria bacterium GWC2_49_35]|jgi:flagellar motor switch protein FliG|uniref:Flagellar motor switch protein FliG n=1 Tax=Candidatus Wallbacteria bacterium GWC2_49_35 TaxID=1817813 RepID=A0A1F7WYH4_9BACT|nr:MAG: flagellar motor switch protein FliG [Candidatus Wallbacteria bacterium GWC2_49_35]HBC76623.1 flagellar motor switch protein FliG [Candidatus Wallbacteria bacterium]